MTTVRPKEWTYEEFMALPEGGPLRYEIIDGELTMTPAPNTRHQEISGNLFRIISTFLHGNPGSGKVFSAPTDVILLWRPPFFQFLSRFCCLVVRFMRDRGNGERLHGFMRVESGVRNPVETDRSPSPGAACFFPLRGGSGTTDEQRG